LSGAAGVDDRKGDLRLSVIVVGDSADEFVEQIVYLFEQADYACMVCEDV
jgi:hypothetical protein